MTIKRFSNCTIIRRHLDRVGHISPHEALAQYGINRLAPRILELRQAGFKIRTANYKDAVGRTYVRYEV